MKHNALWLVVFLMATLPLRAQQGAPAAGSYPAEVMAALEDQEKKDRHPGGNGAPGEIRMGPG